MAYVAVAGLERRLAEKVSDDRTYQQLGFFARMEA